MKAISKIGNAMAPISSVPTATRILVVDDDPLALLVAVRLLASLGYSVVEAHDGAQAVALANHELFRVIVTDMDVPVMESIQATKQIRSSGRNTGTPIIALTSRGTEAQIQEMSDAGVSRNLMKPLDIRTLVEAIETLAPLG